MQGDKKLAPWMARGESEYLERGISNQSDEEIEHMGHNCSEDTSDGMGENCF